MARSEADEEEKRRDGELLDRAIKEALDRAERRLKRALAREDGVVLARTILADPRLEAHGGPNDTAKKMARVFLASHGEE